jgi:hypothetical protein
MARTRSAWPARRPRADMSLEIDGRTFRREVPVSALSPAEVAFAVRQLAATRPHVQALALIVHRDECSGACAAPNSTASTSTSADGIFAAVGLPSS